MVMSNAVDQSDDNGRPVCLCGSVSIYSREDAPKHRVWEMDHTPPPRGTGVLLVLESALDDYDSHNLVLNPYVPVCQQSITVKDAGKSAFHCGHRCQHGLL